MARMCPHCDSKMVQRRVRKDGYAPWRCRPCDAKAQEARRRRKGIAARAAVPEAKECWKCGAEMVQRIRKSGPEAGKSAGWYCRPCAAKKSAAYREKEPDAVLDSKLWCFYRIRLADYRRMVRAQGGRCKACRQVPASTSGIDGAGLVIDHDHRCCSSTSDRWGPDGGRERICGKCIRGLLCTHCNVALGMVNDEPERLTALIEYLAHSATPTDAQTRTAGSPSEIPA